MISVPTLDDEYYRSIDCSKLGHSAGFYKSNRGPVHCNRGIRQFAIPLFSHYSNKNMMSSVENVLNRSYPRFVSTTTTTTAITEQSETTERLDFLATETKKNPWIYIHKNKNIHWSLLECGIYIFNDLDLVTRKSGDTRKCIVVEENPQP